MHETVWVLRSERYYRRLLSASLLSGIGDWFNSVALLSLLLHLTASGLAVGITLAARTLPYLVMGPIGGSLADRVNRKTILVVSDFARALLALSFLFIRSADDVWIAYAGTLGLVLFSALFSPARTAVIPQLVQPKHVMAANALEQSVFGLVMTLGSALGGIVTAAVGTNAAFMINSVSFLISGLICMSIHFPNNHLSPSTNTSPGSNVSSSDRPFWQVFRQSRLVQVIALQSLLWPIGGGVINVLLSVYGYQVFHGGNKGVGILYGSLGAGFLLSGFMAHRCAKRLRQAATVGFLVEGLSHVLVSQSPNLWLASIFLAVATMGGGVGNACISSLVMQNVSREFHGRVFALFDTTSNVTIAVSMMVAGILLDHVPARVLGLEAGSLIVITSLATGFGLLRMKLPTEVTQASQPACVSPEQ
jgi:predicted MFS family arabinose efflux permease